MNARLVRNIEHGVERIAAATFAAALAFAAFAFVGDGQEQIGIVAGALAAIGAYFLCLRVLGALATRQPSFSIAMFEVVEAEPVDELLLTEADRVSCDELLLADADRVFCDELRLTEAHRLGDELVLTDADRLPHTGREPLILDDVLEAIGPDSRVVRLFDRRAMPTPGDVKSRIGSPVEVGPANPGFPDASQELSDALAELRKALR